MKEVYNKRTQQNQQKKFTRKTSSLMPCVKKRRKQNSYQSQQLTFIVYYVPGAMLILSFNHQATFAFQGQIKQLKTEEISED